MSSVTDSAACVMEIYYFDTIFVFSAPLCASPAPGANRKAFVITEYFLPLLTSNVIA